jgi:hypothetical protein
VNSGPNHRTGFSRAASGSAERTSVSEIGLGALFAVYGPSFSFLGQLRYVEVVLLLAFPFLLLRYARFIDGRHMQLCCLFILAAVFEIVAGFVYGSTAYAIIARAGTYFVLAMLILIIAMLVRANERRLLAIVFGYCLSYVFIVFVGTQTSPGYEEQPWRLGLGAAAAVALCATFPISPKLEKLSTLALLAMAFFLLTLGARSLGIAVLITSGLCLLRHFRSSPVPVTSIAMPVAITVFAFVVSYNLIEPTVRFVLNLNVFGDEVTARTLEQFDHPQGLLAAARPDTYAAIYGFLQRPLLGYGPGVLDPGVYDFFSVVVAENYSRDDAFEQVYVRQMEDEWTVGNPSHSHVFGAIVEAGIGAALCWVVVFGNATCVLYRSMFWTNKLAPLYMLISLMCLWDLLFSPGPERLDMAIRLEILYFALRQMASLDQSRGIRSFAASFAANDCFQFQGARKRGPNRDRIRPP